MEERHVEEILIIENASQSSPWSRQSFLNEIGRENGSFLVAEDKGRVLGFAGMWQVVDEAHIITVAVDPNRRRSGIGRKLIIELLLRARADGASCSTLEVRANNEVAIKLYESLGFKSVGIRKRYYPDNREDAVVMWLYELEDWDPSQTSSQLATQNSSE